MPETFLKLGSRFEKKQGNEANCPKCLKFCGNGDKTLFTENVNTIEHGYQFLTTTRFSLFSRVIQKRKCFPFLVSFRRAISQNEWYNERKQTKTKRRINTKQVLKK